MSKLNHLVSLMYSRSEAEPIKFVETMESNELHGDVTKLQHNVLHLALELRLMKLSKSIISKADKSIIAGKDFTNDTTLMHAASLGATEICASIIKIADKDFILKKDSSLGFTALHEAANVGSVKLLKC